MNKKLLAAAIASTLAVPAISQGAAHGDGANWYGRINTAVEIIDTDEDTVVGLRNISSRFGVRGAQDLGNGLSVVYRYEFGVDSTVADVQDNNRLSYVGFKGGFGQVIMGRVWSAAFNHVGTIMDPSQNIGGDAYNGPYRTSNTISYSGNAGPVALQFDVVVDDANENSDGADAFGIGGTFSTGAITVAGAFNSTDGGNADDTDFTAIAAKMDLESLWVGGGWTSTDDGSDDETTGIALLAGGSSGDFSWWASVEDISDDDSGDADAINIHLTRHTSKTSRVYAEIAINGGETDADDSNEVLLGARVDF